MAERGRELALTFIIGDEYKTDEVKKMLESVEPFVSGIFASYNGKKSRFPRFSRYTSHPIKWGRTEWNDDFAAARNHSFSLVPREDFDWMLWLDTDDVFRAPDGLDVIFDKLDEYTEGVFLRYAYAVEPRTGTVVVEQWRERLLSTRWPWQWKWPIHEACIGPPGTQYARRDEAWVEHLRQSGEDRGARERNRRIIAKHMKEEPDETRYMYYFANEAMAAASELPEGPERVKLCDAAILQYRKFLEKMAAGQTDDVYSAAVRIGDLHVLAGRQNEAVDAYMQAIKFYPNWPDAYVGIAKVFMEQGDFGRMKEFADIATKFGKPTTTAAIEPMSSGFHPIFLRGIAREELGEKEEALEDYRAALKIWRPPEGHLEQKIEELEAELAEKGDEGEDLWDVRKERRGTRPEKSICFFTNPIAEIWNWDTLEEGGHGGAETMILELAPMFAADGWRVSVFGTPGTENRGLHDNGVEMYNHDEWLPSEEQTVFVSSRAADPFHSPINAKAKLLWMHDVNIGGGLLNVADQIDCIVALTMWHADFLSRLYGIPEEKIAIVPNGIDISKYPKRTEWRDTPDMIYASSPDRGLEELLAMWPIIRDRHPDATLKIYYGWHFIDKLIAMGYSPLYLKPLKARINRAVEALGREQGGIYWMDRQPPDKLRDGYYESEIWAYPTQFMETFCITAIQAQAAGVIPITSQLAALNETVSCPWYTLQGWPKNSDYQSRFLQMVEKALDPANAGSRETARAMGRRHAEKFSLENAYRSWNELFVKLGVRVPAGQVALTP